MLIKQIDNIIPDRLYAVQWNGCEENCFEELFEWLTDVQAMRAYFLAKETIITKGFYRVPTVEEAVLRTIDEGEAFATELLQAAEGQAEEELDLIFEELSPGVHLLQYRQYKAKGDADAPWIRVYAVKLEQAYIISGGGIKLVKKMQEDPDLVKELDKIKHLDQYLKDEHIFNTDALNEEE